MSAYRDRSNHSGWNFLTFLVDLIIFYPLINQKKCAIKGDFFTGFTVVLEIAS